MKKLILKELREQYKIALIGLAILTVMLSLEFAGYGSHLRQVMSMAQGPSESFQPLLKHALLVQVSIFCAVFGMLLGWLQIRAEKHPDLWAFLVHRPISRNIILRSKVVSGFVLYAAGAGLPLFGIILVVSIPGNVAAPFTWAMALPLISIFLVGMVYYFAGLLTGVRKARWFASRGVGLGLGVLANIFLFVMPEFWHALLIIVVTGSLLALAAWGSFQTGGYYRDQPIAGKVALIVTSSVSVLVILGLTTTFVVNLALSRGEYTTSYYQLTKEGNIIRIFRQGFDEEVVDINGQTVLDEKSGQKIKQQDLQQPQQLWATTKGNGQRGSYQQQSFFNITRFFSAWRVKDQALWYLTADGRLVAYDVITRRFAGILAPSGGGDGGMANDSRFLLPPEYGPGYFNNHQTRGVLASARTAYLVDLEKRQLKPLFTVTNGDAIQGFAGARSARLEAANGSVLLLTRTSIRLLDVEGRTKLHLPYVPSSPEYPMVNFFWLEPAGFAVRFDPDHLLSEKSGGKLLSHVKWVNPDGSIRKAQDLPKLPELIQKNADRFFVSLLPPIFPLWSLNESYRVWSGFRIVPAILCAGIGWWLGRRNNFTLKAQIGWGVFHLLFGLPGFLAFLAVQEWPPRESCPGCNKLRVIDRESCEHCGANFAPPEKTGTEIFEPLTYQS